MNEVYAAKAGAIGETNTVTGLDAIQGRLEGHLLLDVGVPLDTNTALVSGETLIPIFLLPAAVAEQTTLGAGPLLDADLPR